MDTRAALSFLLLASPAAPPALAASAGFGRGKLVAVEAPSPAAPGAIRPVLAAAGEGRIRLTWLEPAGAGGWALRCASFARSGGGWGRAVTVAIGGGFSRDSSDLPAFAAGFGETAVAWTAVSADSRRVMVSLSADGGLSWSAPAPLSRAGADAFSPALAALADGRIAAAWIERRPGSDTGLQLSILGNESAAERLLDTGIGGGCQPMLAPLLDGGMLAAYRGRRPGGSWQPRLARWPGSPAPAHDIDGEPDDGGDAGGGGPRISADGGRVVAAWVAENASGARLLVSASPDAGTRFQLPVTARSGEGRPRFPSAAILHDGASLVVWVQSAVPGSGETVRLGRFSPDLRSLPAPIAVAAGGPVASPPQIALVRDYAGSSTGAEALVAFAAGGSDARIHVLRVTADEGAFLAAADDDCRCAPTAAQLAGYPVRGSITEVRPGAGTLTLDLDAAPGVMEPGPQVFHAAAATLAAARVGRQCLGRIERQSGGWRFFDLRLLEETP